MHAGIGKMRTCGLRDSGGTTSRETEHNPKIARCVCGAQDCALHACKRCTKVCITHITLDGAHERPGTLRIDTLFLGTAHPAYVGIQC
jgi:hypothetical protein